MASFDALDVAAEEFDEGSCADAGTASLVNDAKNERMKAIGAKYRQIRLPRQAISRPFDGSFSIVLVLERNKTASWTRRCAQQKQFTLYGGASPATAKLLKRSLDPVKLWKASCWLHDQKGKRKIPIPQIENLARNLTVPFTCPVEYKNGCDVDSPSPAVRKGWIYRSVYRCSGSVLVAIPAARTYRSRNPCQKDSQSDLSEFFVCLFLGGTCTMPLTIVLDGLPGQFLTPQGESELASTTLIILNPAGHTVVSIC